jgi:hypothetical protein
VMATHRYRLDLGRAKSLLVQAGYGDGFAVRIDTLGSPPFPEAVRETLARSGSRRRS